jgi:DNA helicase-2/ATP-dependent DNA helicase PcrA
MDILDDLNPVQRAAASYMGGPLLILAGAGSGKTRALTYRVAYLIGQGVAPHQILAVTFTNKAANEMRSRIEQLVGPRAKGCWIGTFHATCARMLRQDGERVGLHHDFVVFDDSDQITLLREAMAELNVDTETFKPRQMLTHIGRAKEELLSPEAYARRAESYDEKMAARIYPVYQRKLSENRAVDFDDLIFHTVRLLRDDKETREHYRARFEHILVDEYQDINAGQYELVKLLATRKHHLCVVGDDDQCLPAGTQVRTAAGAVPLETIEAGDCVLGGAGWGEVAEACVEAAAARPYEGKLVRIRTDSGDELAATPNHLLFARMEPCAELHYVYLMRRQGLGYRIGKTRGVRSRKANEELVSGLAVRADGEVADEIYVLKTCRTDAEAGYFEQYFAFQYGIPTMVFHVRGRKMAFSQESVDRLYRSIDTETRAHRLLEDLFLCAEYPHHRPSAIIRGESSRGIVYLTLFGDPRPHQRRPWHEHRIQLISSDQALRPKIDAVQRTRSGQRQTWRVETNREDHDEALAFARRLVQTDNLELVARARLTPAPAYLMMPASHVQVGMKVPVYRDDAVCEATVTDVDWEEYSGSVYDLSVADLRNYVADGLVVHNSVYGWRGADVRFILAFEDDYPNAKVLKLEQNYRSTQTILDAAHHVVSKNRGRREKRLWTENPAGEGISAYFADDEVDEARYIADAIEREAGDQGRPFSDYAILYRTNAQSRVFEDVFRRRRIPYRIVGSLRFYDRKEVKDLIAYLRLLQNDADSLSLKRVLNAPPRGIGQKTLERLEAWAQGHQETLFAALRAAARVEGIGTRQRTSIGEFVQALDALRELREKLPVAGLVREVIGQTGYLKALEEERTLEAQARRDNVQEMVNVAQEFDQQVGGTLRDFLEQMALMSDVDSLREEANAVTLMTLHAAKGLEFPCVFIAGMEEDVFPHARSRYNDSQLEEERRLCYVGLTRARRRLVLTHARRRMVFGQTLYQSPSRFLNDIPEELFREDAAVARTGVRPPDPWDSEGTVIGRGARRSPSPAPAGRSASSLGSVDLNGLIDQFKSRPKGAFQPGDRVRHPTFGDGIVTRSNGTGDDEQVTVIFAGQGEKKLIAGYARLEKL